MSSEDHSKAVPSEREAREEVIPPVAEERTPLSIIKLTSSPSELSVSPGRTHFFYIQFSSNSIMGSFSFIFFFIS